MTAAVAVFEEAPSTDEEDDLARELGLLNGHAARNLLRVRDGLLGLEKWALFAGAGVSRSAGLPTWDELTRRLAQRYKIDCPRNPADNAYPSIIAACLARASSSDDFWKTVADEVCHGTPGELHRLLLQLPFEVFLTINFDCLLERVHREMEGVLAPRVIAYPEPDLQAPNVHGRRLIHLHGLCRDGEPRLAEDSTVLTQSAYERAYRLTPLPAVIEAAVSTYALLFVGTSMSDWQIRLMLSRVRERERLLEQTVPDRPARIEQGFALVETDGFDAGPGARWSWPGTTLGIEPIFYLNEDGQHAALVNSLTWLARSTGPVGRTGYEVPE